MRATPQRIIDRRRVCVLLRADGWSYEEIAQFLGVKLRLVREDLQNVVEDEADLLGYRQETNQNRLMRLIYLMGVQDGLQDDEDAPLEYHLDSLLHRAELLRQRIRWERQS